MNKIILDKDLQDMVSGATSPYESQRAPSQGAVQIHAIQAIRNLQNTIKMLDKQNSKLQNTMVFLSVVTVALTIVQIIVAFSNLS